MKPHPYVRAYMAGIVVPTVFLLALMTLYVTLRFVVAPDQLAALFERPGGPLERVIVFPLALVPNLWGAWNMLHVALRRRAHLPLGIHGAALPLFLIPAGVALARTLGAFDVPPASAIVLVPVAMAVYYLVWKHAVGFLNQEMGIA